MARIIQFNSAFKSPILRILALMRLAVARGGNPHELDEERVRALCGI